MPSNLDDQNKVLRVSFGILAVLFAFITVSGVITGGASSGYVHKMFILFVTAGSALLTLILTGLVYLFRKRES